MAITLKVLREVEEALDELREATYNRDINKADKIKRVLIDYLKPEGYTLKEDREKLYVVSVIQGIQPS